MRTWHLLLASAFLLLLVPLPTRGADDCGVAAVQSFESGSASNLVAFCGDGICESEAGEDCASCPEDCSCTPLPPELEWAMNYQRFLDAYPDLTADQVGLVLGLIDLGTPEYFATDPGSEQWEPMVAQPLTTLLDQAAIEFPNDQYADLYSKAIATPGWDLLVDQGRVIIPFCTCSKIGGNCRPVGSTITGKCHQVQCITSSGSSLKIGVCGV